MSRYWQKRQKQWIKNQDRDDKLVADKLAKDYQKVAEDLEKEIAAYFAEYGKDEVLEFRELLKDLSDKDKKMLFENMEKFALKYPEYEHLLPVRESIYKLNRLQGLHYSTQLQLVELGVIEEKALEQHLVKTYGKQYQNVMNELGIGSAFLGVDETTALKVAYTKWVADGNFSDRIWQNKRKLMNFIESDLKTALIKGDNYNKIIEKLIDRTEVGAYEARRLVWTESSFVLNQAHTQPYVDAGMEEYRIEAVLDHKTSDICRTMHKRAEQGETFRFDEIEVGLNFPPFHAFCRSTFTGVGTEDILKK